MSVRSGFVVLVVVMVAGCGEGVVVGDDPIPTEPSTVSSSTVPVVVDCPNFVTDVKTGPEPTDFSEDGPLAREQNRLQSDAERVMGYAAQHGDEFGSLRFENSPRVRLVIGFIDHLGEHCAALRGLLEFPDEFELVQDRVTEATLRSIQDEVVQMAGAYLRSAGSGSASGTVTVDLRADGEQIAAEIIDRYGDLVDVTVGVLSYPDRTVGEGLPCDRLIPPAPTEALSLVATLVLNDSEVVSGADFGGVATVTNTGEGVVHFESGSPLVALVFRPASSEVIGVFAGGIGGVGVGADLAPGESIDIEVLGGTASCDPDLGYALPPGEYEARVPVAQYEYPDGQFELHAILTEPASLTVTE